MADSPGMLAALAALLQGAHSLGQRVGGNKFGGNTFGGNTYGGNQFGASARPSVTVPATPPSLPPFQPPGQTMNTFAPMPSATSLASQYRLGQNAQTPPQAAPAASPSAAPPSPTMPAADPNAPVSVPPLPPSVSVGQAPGMQQPSALSDVWQSLLRMRGQDPNTPPPWTTNFGNNADQRG